MVTPASDAESIKEWIAKYERPTVYPFDDRTIGQIFGERAVGVILFQQNEAGEVLADSFNNAAHESRIERLKNYIFTDIPVPFR